MTTYPFMQVDAFTKRPLAGNPCAILFDTESLTDAQMLAIAKEMNLSETSFVRRSAVADVADDVPDQPETTPAAGTSVEPTVEPRATSLILQPGLETRARGTGGSKDTIQVPYHESVDIKLDGRVDESIWLTAQASVSVRGCVSPPPTS